MHENRVKLYFVSEEEVLRTCLRSFPDSMVVTRHKELPVGYQILRVEHDYDRRGFLFMVFHPTFPEVPIGTEIPRMDFDTVQVLYTVKPYKPEEE